MCVLFSKPAKKKYILYIRSASPNSYSISPEGEECLLSVSCNSRSDGQHEGNDAKGSMDRHKASSELCRALFTAQQDPEAEEPNHKLKKGRTHCERHQKVMLSFYILCLLMHSSWNCLNTWPTT